MSNITIFWMIVSFILSFNDLLGLFVSKIILRYAYITFMGCLLFSSYIKYVSKKQHISIAFSKKEGYIYLFLLFVILRFLIQYLTGNTNSASLISFVQLIIPIFSYFLARRISDVEAFTIEKSFCIFAAVSAILGIIDVSFFKFLPSKGAFAGGLYAFTAGGEVSLRGYSMAGSALTTGFIMSLSTLFCTFNWNKWNYVTGKVIVLSLSLLSCFFSLSRGAIFMLLIVMVYHNFPHIIKGIGKIKLKYLCMLYLVLLIIIINFQNIINSPVYKRIFVSGIFSEERANHKRIVFIENAIDNSMEYPILGLGFGYTGFQAAKAKVNNYVNTESTIISIALNAGVGVAILFLCIFISFIREKNTLKPETVKKYQSIVVGMFAWSIFYILLDSDLNAMFFWYCLGRIGSKL